MSTELFPVLAWTIARLKTVTANVHERPAPEGTATPFIGYSLDMDSHKPGIGGGVQMARGDLLAVAIGTGSPASVKTLVEGIRAALHLQGGVRDGYYVFAYETAPFKLPVYRLNGVPIYEIGATFRVVASKVPEVAPVSP